MNPEARQTPGDATVSRLLWSQIIWRHWKQEPRLTAVLVGILALGVAVFLSIHLANKAAVSGFGMFTESIAGQSDAILRPRAGMLDEAVLLELRETAGDYAIGIFPVLEISAAIGEGEEKDLLRLVGADLVALQNAASYTDGESSTFGGGAVASSGGDSVLGRSDVGFVGAAFAKRFDVEQGETVSIVVNDRAVDLNIKGILPEDPNRVPVPDHLVLLDLPGLQSLAQAETAISRVEFRAPPGPTTDQMKKDALATIWDWSQEKGYLLETPSDRKSSVTKMSGAFRLNLTILSGLALLVGMYLILQAMEAAVVKRRAEIATLRSLGVTPKQIRRAWILEGVLLGTVGALIGVFLGRLLATAMVGAIAKTVNTLYYRTTTTAVTLEWREIVFCLAFGLIASLIAVAIPARDASLTPPAHAIRRGTQGGGLSVLRKHGLGLILVGSGIASTWLPSWKTTSGTSVPIGGYLAAVLLVFGASILIGILFRPIARMLRHSDGDAMRVHAASQLARPEGRHRLTAAGLSVAIGMSAAMAILVASFETTLTSWIQQLLRADIYVAPAGMSAVTNENAVSEPTWRAIEATPGVAGADKLRRYTVSLGNADFFLGGADYNTGSERYLQLMWQDAPADTGPRSLVEKIDDRFPGWISESMARRFQLEKGSRIDLPTPDGEKPISVTGIFAEYGNETGTLIVARELTSQWFDDNSVSNLALYLDEKAEPEKVLEAIREQFPTLTVQTNARLRSESIRIFHQTFAVTYALEAIAVIIAVSGLGLALAGLLLERKSELATLKSLGASRSEIARGAMWEGIGLSLVGFAGGIILSFFLGWVLIHVINPQSFGWTLTYRVPWISFLALGGITIAAAAIVAHLVGFKNANLRSDTRE